MKDTVKNTICFVVLCMVTIIRSTAQDAQFLWEKHFHGQNLMFENNVDKITTVETDSIGNVYVFGTFGLNARLEGQYICPIEDDTNYAKCNELGIFLAKFDTLGTMQWCKSARYRGSTGSNGGVSSVDMVLKGDRIYTLGYLTFTPAYNLNLPDWCWFFDTMYVSPNYIDYYYWDWPPMPNFPFRTQGTVNVFAVFDLNGNKLENHTLELFVDDEGFYGDVHISQRILGRFVVNSDDNILLFVNPRFSGKEWDSVYTPYIIIDDDTSNRISLGLENHFNNCYDQHSSAMLWKIDRGWQHVECKLIIDSVAGWSRRFKVDSVYNNYYQRNLPVFCEPASLAYNGITIDEQDRIYVSGFVNANSEYTYYDGDTLQELTLPCRFFLDSTHYLTAENLSMLGSLPFVIQYDHDGNVLWCKQLYSESPSILTEMMTMGDCIVDSSNVYVGMNTYSPYGDEEVSNVFFDPAHLDTFPKVHHYISGYNSYTASCAIYDRETGTGISHHTIDTQAYLVGKCSDNKGDYLVYSMGRGYVDNNANYVVKYNKRTGLSTISQPLVRDEVGMLGSDPNLYANSHGFVIRTDRGSAIHQSGLDIVFNQGNSAFLLFYYDSTLDCRRPHATPPTPPDPPDPPEDSTAVHHVEAPVLTFSLNPNPTTGEVTIEVKGERWKVRGGEMTVTVCDASGREVRRHPLPPATEGTRLRLDLKGLPSAPTSSP